MSAPSARTSSRVARRSTSVRSRDELTARLTATSVSACASRRAVSAWSWAFSNASAAWSLIASTSAVSSSVKACGSCNHATKKAPTGSPPLAPGLLEDRVAAERDRVGQEAPEQILRHPVARDRAEDPRLVAGDERPDHVGADGAAGLPGDPPHHLGEVERRVERAADVYERLGAPEPLLRRLVESGVLERHGALGAERPGEAPPGGGDPPPLDVPDAERADDPVLDAERHREHAPVGRPLEERPELRRQLDAGARQEGPGGRRLALAEGQADHARAGGQLQARVEGRLEGARDGDGPDGAGLRVEGPDDGHASVQEAPHAQRDLVRHRGGVERLAEDPPDVGHPPLGLVARVVRARRRASAAGRSPRPGRPWFPSRRRRAPARFGPGVPSRDPSWVPPESQHSPCHGADGLKDHGLAVRPGSPMVRIWPWRRALTVRADTERQKRPELPGRLCTLGAPGAPQAPHSPGAPAQPWRPSTTRLARRLSAHAVAAPDHAVGVRPLVAFLALAVLVGAAAHPAHGGAARPARPRAPGPGAP